MGKKKLALTKKNLKQSIIEAENWILLSGIQNSSKKYFGSVNAWYDPKKKKYSFIYSEINGYFLTLMVYLYKRSKNKLYLKRAISSAKWLIKNTQKKNGGFSCLTVIDKHSSHNFKKDLIYSFDNGVILNGLCSLYKITKKQFLLNSSKRCANWLINSCIEKNYDVKPIYDIKVSKFFSSDKEWSTTSGSYHTKISMGLMNLYSITKITKYKKNAKGICSNSLKFQKKDGRFISFPIKGGTNAHPHCYSAEGLWSIGKFLNNNRFLKSSHMATKWIISKKNKKCLIPRLFIDNKPIFFERVDAIAQVLRLNFLNNNFGKKNLIAKNDLIKIVNLLLKNQVKNKNNHKINGSFIWGKKSTGEIVKHSNSWVTFFSLQALNMVNDYFDKIDFNLEEFDLI